MSSAPKSVIDVAKSAVCQKSPFPFGNGHDAYSPSCVIDVNSCKEICGRKCTGVCKTQHLQCDRGHLPNNFLYCQFSVNLMDEITLPYVTYEVVEETNVKDGKKPYKRYEMILFYHFLYILLQN